MWQVLTLRQTKYISLLLRSGFFPFATNNRRISFHYVITINTQKTAAGRNPLVFSLPLISLPTQALVGLHRFREFLTLYSS
jgi:hypothetical protein